MEIIDSDATIEPREQLAESFAPSDLPPLAADGGFEDDPAPLRLPVLSDPICDRGPCRHRHVLKVAVEAGEPLDGGSHERPKLGPDGEPIIKYVEPDVIGWDGTPRPGRTIYETEAYTPMQVTRVCYPAPGVKIELGEDEPIAECSLWDPECPDDPDTHARRVRRLKYEQREKEAKALEDAKRAAAPAPDVEDLNREDAASDTTPGVKRKK